jgi:hypothetical protein
MKGGKVCLNGPYEEVKENPFVKELLTIHKKNTANQEPRLCNSTLLDSKTET